VLVDFDHQRIYFFLNHKLEGFIECKDDMMTGTDPKLVEGQIWPCVQLGMDSAVVLRFVWLLVVGC
jgi:hypothetical protein